MDQLTLWNLAAYSAQLASIVVLAGVAAAVLRIDVAAARYAFWRGVLALCLLLPLVQGRQDPSAGDLPVVFADTQATVTAVGTTARAGAVLDWNWVIVSVLAAGAVARLVWIGLSLLRLRRMRRLGERAPQSPVLTELQQIIGTACEVRYVTGLKQPVTFGLRRPVILLPASLAQRDEDVQRAVLSHELFHVKRRDWGWLLAEELTCAVLWFNPALWWLVSRVQLAREVVVDELAVLATGRRRAYIQALVTFADDTSLTTVAAFGGRRQLFNRIVLLSKEAVMSSRRLVITCGVLAATVAAGAWQVVGAFPLTAAPQQTARQAGPGPVEQRTVPITPENPVPRRVNYEPPAYPDVARVAGARGNVTLMITLDELGRVVETRRVRLSVASRTPPASVTFATVSEGEGRFIVNGSQEQSDNLRAVAYAFEAAAIRSVQQWRYDPPASGPIAFEVRLNFSDGSEPAPAETPGQVIAGGVRSDGALRIGGAIKTPVKLKDARPVYPPVAQSARVSGHVILEIRVGPDGMVEEAHVLRSIPLLDQAAIDAVMKWQFQPTHLNGSPTAVIMTVTVNFALQGRGPSGVEPPTVMATAAIPQGTPPQVVAPKKVLPSIVKEVKPIYPGDAFDANVQGTVEMSVTIGVDGKVTDARVTRSVPMLDDAALAAVRQWTFTRVEQPVTVDIEMSFTKRSKR